MQLYNTNNLQSCDQKSETNNNRCISYVNRRINSSLIIIKLIKIFTYLELEKLNKNLRFEKIIL